MLLPASEAFAAARTLRGTVIYRERIALPPTTIVEVKLLDVSLADAPARTIAETRIAAGPRNPIRYILRFDSAQIQPRRSYALQARITDGDRLMFINTTRHPVFAGGRNQTEIRVERVGGQAEAPRQPSPAGRWLAEDIRGGGVIDRLQSVLEIAPDGRVSGTGGCNRIGGRATISGATIAFGRMISTQMACTPAAMDQERKFLLALEDARGWRVDPVRQKLVLADARGTPVLVLARM
ncbi:META domain-containing protein [Phreatobacter stygius]|uniref:META domain-containing protein n=2 Tax=Phreatobacter stygius TaxID=1940610 RepID=A0A4D7B7G9_9HYPH|nr:META domain-containing protein [Phreatobacter stygius]